MLLATLVTGSPQAAEFHNDSPSASLTPMPTKEAKEKYTIPDTSMSSMDTSNASSSMSNTLNEDADNTVELEGDLNALMTSISQGHGTNDADADENTVELEGDISALLKSADDTHHDDESEATDVPEEDRTMEVRNCEDEAQQRAKRRADSTGSSCFSLRSSL